jgi:propionate catabolism operon transcriptional regulator
VALFLEAEPLQALTPAFLLTVAPELSGDATTTPASTQAAEHESIQQVLARFGGNREAAARHLGISRTTLWRRLNASSIRAPE